MPNKYQLAFLATFVSVFTSLILLSRLLDRKLRAAGYDYRNIILIGLDKPDPIQDAPPMSLYQLVESLIPAGLQSLDLPVVGTVDVVAVTSSPAFLVSTAILVATAVWSQVVHKSTHTLFHFVSILISFQPVPNRWTLTRSRSSPSRKRSRFHPTPPCMLPPAPLRVPS